MKINLSSRILVDVSTSGERPLSILLRACGKRKPSDNTSEEEKIFIILQTNSLKSAEK